MPGRRDAGLKRCRTGEIKVRRDMDWRVAGKEGFSEEGCRWDSGEGGCRKMRMQQRRKQERRDAVQRL